MLVGPFRKTEVQTEGQQLPVEHVDFFSVQITLMNPMVSHPIVRKRLCWNR